MIMVPITSWIVVNFGWRTSYFIMGWLILSMAPLCLILIKTRPSDMGLKPDGGMIEQTIDYKAVLEGVSLKRALKSRAFWLILSMMFIFGMVGMGIGLHLMPYLTDIGHTEIIAGLIISGLSALTVAGKVGMGFIADRWGI